MKTHCYIVMLFAMLGVLNGMDVVMCQEPSPIKGRPEYHVGYSHGMQLDAGLKAYGDYTKLKLIIRSEQRDYNPGEHVDIKFFVRNESDSEVHIWGLAPTRCCAHLWKLFHSNYEEAARTPKWEEIIQKRKQQGRYGVSWVEWKGACFMKLKPGQEQEVDEVYLGGYFNLTKPDTYELTCFQSSFIEGQEYEPPLQSNTLTFRVLEELNMNSTNTNEYPDTPYTNPPPGQEVFKQPKPPKNVFYDASQPPDPAKKPSVYRGWEKEQAAQAAKPPDEVKPSKE